MFWKRPGFSQAAPSIPKSPVRVKTRRAICQSSNAAPVCVHDVDLLRVLVPGGRDHDPAVRAVPRFGVGRRVICEPLRTAGAVDIRHIYLVIAVAVRRPGDLCAVRRPRRVRVDRRVVGQPPKCTEHAIKDHDVVIRAEAVARKCDLVPVRRLCGYISWKLSVVHWAWLVGIAASIYISSALPITPFGPISVQR
jgi:hypothetical protein